MEKPLDTEVCKFFALDPTWHGQRGYVGINESMGLYVIPSGSGYSCLGFDVAERKRRAVLAWLGKGILDCQPGTLQAYQAYLEAMRAGSEHNRKTGARCPADLIPALVGLEGKRVAVTKDGQEIGRFYVGKSTGWLPCHLEIKSRDSSGGCGAYIPEGATVRVVGVR